MFNKTKQFNKRLTSIEIDSEVNAKTIIKLAEDVKKIKEEIEIPEFLHLKNALELMLRKIHAIADFLEIEFKEELEDDPAYSKPETKKRRIMKCRKKSKIND